MVVNDGVHSNQAADVSRRAMMPIASIMRDDPIPEDEEKQATARIDHEDVVIEDTDSDVENDEDLDA